MTREQRLANILTETAKNHQLALVKKGGEDPDWPKWYAKFLLKNTDFSKIIPGLNETTLAHLLEMLDHQLKHDTTRQTWEHYYARKLLKIG